MSVPTTGTSPRLRVRHRSRQDDLLAHEPPAVRVQVAIVISALIVGVAAFTISLTSSVLRYPGWLAVYDVNLILAPVLVGLYWWRLRPASRLGPLLVAFGFLASLLVLQGASNRYLHWFGVAVDGPFFLMTIYLLLAFPTGRLRGRADRAIVVATVLGVLGTFVPYLLVADRLSAGGPIAACRELCPANVFRLGAHPGLLSTFVDLLWYVAIGLTLATALLLASRYLRGAPPQRRSLASGVSIGVVFCLAFAAFHLLLLIDPSHAQPRPALQWTLAAARSSLAWGMLVALAAAELYGGRLLARLVAVALQRPDIAELERTIATAVHDPSLRLAFWSPERDGYVDAAGQDIAAPPARSGRTLTEVRRDGDKAVAILHDEQLREGPELVRAAGAAALLAFENARLEHDLRAVIADLRRSRARLATASDTERRRLERDLHDGAQQQFIAARMRLAAIRRETFEDASRQRLSELDADIGRGLESLRELARGIYPALLADAGLGPALEAIGDRSAFPLTISVAAARYPIEIESAVYFCALEAIQNATKHAGPLAAPVILVGEDEGALHLTVRDRGHGFDCSSVPTGSGLRNMHDRIGAIGGELVVSSVPGRGTVVRARVPTGHGDRAITLDG